MFVGRASLGVGKRVLSQSASGFGFGCRRMWAPPRRSGLGNGNGNGNGNGSAAAGAIGKPPTTPLQVLLQMGFPRHRAIKALAATGNKSVQLASDWLLTHVSDASLDEDIPREYILYACPTGPLQEQLQEYWMKSKEHFGWNGAHNFTPHITLVSFFKAPDECSLQLSKVLKQVIETVGQPSEDFLALEMYTSPNFMGLFVSEDHAEFLKSIAVQYVKQVSSSTICLEPHVKSLHVTLAYQFTSNVYKPLKNLAESLVPLEKALWELRLYSRDPRLATHHVHKVKHVYNSVESDELELRLGDYIYIEESALKNSPDGWVQGISWLTGMTGYLPAVYTERTAESDAWTLHRAVPLGGQNLLLDNKCSSKATSSNESLCHLVSNTDVDSAIMDSGSTEPVEKTPEKVSKNWDPVTKDLMKEAVKLLSKTSLLSDTDTLNLISSSEVSSNETIQDDQGPTRNIYIMRHGERVDFTFGSWVPYCFDEDDNYIRKDMNMPATLPKRIGGSPTYTQDGPLTMLGRLQAQLVGEGLRSAGVTLSYIYASPSFRCVQTAQSVLDGLKAPASVKIRVEPSLFEWLVWYPTGPPKWMTMKELQSADLNVDTEYEPLLKIGESPFIEVCEDADCLEDCDQFYERNGRFFKHALQETESTGGSIMFIGHAITLDTAWRGLTGLGTRDGASLGRVMRGVTYCSMAAMRGPPWQLVPPPCPPSMNTANKRFDWKILKEE
ncbi:ecdysteroid phosphate phosphatase [Arctopsyche grandis]|uniref:ecdysteroid phosphate phosphatase n=1 Tax=Arctopsyche grandis TaxID=121162 RepID=UPI00406D673D